MKFKQGGIVKAAIGTDLKYTPVKSLAQKYKEQKEEEYRKAESEKLLKQYEQLLRSQAKAEESERPAELFEPINNPDNSVFNYDNLPTSTKARLWAIGSDLTSAVSAYIPVVGTTVSAGSGLLSTGLNLYSDLVEGIDGAWTNAGAALGMDALGLIPGVGTAGKLGKIAKTIKSLSAVIGPALTAYQLWDNGAEIKNSFDKVFRGDFDQLTMDDYSNLSQGILIIMGTAGAVGNAKTVKKHLIRQGTSTSVPTYNVTTKGGKKVEFSLSEYDLLRKTASGKTKEEALKAQNELLIEWGKNDPERFKNVLLDTPFVDSAFLNHFRPMSSSPDVQKSKKVTSTNGTLRTNDKWTLTEQWLYNPETADPKRYALDAKLSKWLSNRTGILDPSWGAIDNPYKANQAKKLAALLNTELSNQTLLKGGTLNIPNIRQKYKEGGILKAQGGASVSNTKANNEYSWDNLIYNTDYFKQALGTINLSNFEDANKLLNRYADEHINLNWKNNRATAREEVTKYSLDFNKAYGEYLNKGAIEDAITNGFITRAGKTSDNAAGNWTDAYSGAMMNLRHLGASAHSGYIEEMNKILNKNGLEAFVNNDTLMINYRPIRPNNKIPTIAADQTQDWGSEGSGEYVPERTPSNYSSLVLRAAQLAPYGLDIWRLIGTRNTNRNNYNVVRKSIRPYLKDPYNFYSPVTGAFSELLLAGTQGAQTMLMADRMATNDVDRNTAIMLEANKLKVDRERQGNLTNDQEIKRTRAEALARDEKSHVSNVDTANFNRESLNKFRREQGQLEADYNLKQWNALNNYATGLGADIRQKLSEWKAFTQEAHQAANLVAANNLTNLMRTEYQEWANSERAAGKIPSLGNWDRYKYYETESRNLRDKLLLEYYDLIAEINGYPKWNFGTAHKPLGWNYTDYSK